MDGEMNLEHDADAPFALRRILFLLRSLLPEGLFQTIRYDEIVPNDELPFKLFARHREIFRFDARGAFCRPE